MLRVATRRRREERPKRRGRADNVGSDVRDFGVAEEWVGRRLTV